MTPRKRTPPKSGGMEESTALYVVDRHEGKIVVLVDEAGRQHDIEARALPAGARDEGAVIRVPEGPGGPRWHDAMRDRDEEHRRLREARDRLDRLGRNDPGGDIVL